MPLSDIFEVVGMALGAACLVWAYVLVMRLDAAEGNRRIQEKEKK